MGMHKNLRNYIVIATTLFAFGLPSHAAPNEAREFIMSCTYGVLAGTLVGAASLAFVDKPGDNLQRVARGASLGLYAGIGLGYYTVYYLPKQLQREEEERLDPDNQTEQGRKENNFSIFPIIADAQTYGLGMGYRF